MKGSLVLLAGGAATLAALGCSSQKSICPKASSFIQDTTPAPRANVPVRAKLDTELVKLNSWHPTSSRDKILEFVARVTDETKSDFVPVNERIVVFDNDGTLWLEQPLYPQLAFAMHQIKAKAKEHPKWKTTQPFQAVLEDDHAALHASGTKGIVQLILASHSGMSTDEFTKEVKAWLKSARHPQFKRPYTELVYQPMLELLQLLRDNEFKIFIVSGGGVDFMRVFAEEVYGIPPERVIGTTLVTRYVSSDISPTIERTAKISFIDDKAGKEGGRI